MLKLAKKIKTKIKFNKFILLNNVFNYISNKATFINFFIFLIQTIK